MRSDDCWAKVHNGPESIQKALVMVIEELMAERERERNRESFNRPVDVFFLCATSWKAAKDGSVVVKRLACQNPHAVGNERLDVATRPLLVDNASDSPG